MNDKQKYCPECNSPIEEGEKFCENCGATLSTQKADEKQQSNSGTILKSPTNGRQQVKADEKNDDDISRNNVMGSINKTTTNSTTNSLTKNNVDNSTNTSTVNSNVMNTSSSVDNSTVHNNTTIVMGGKNEPEFCEVCGNPFDDKHARCPKCGKSICFDCKVKGKNRCVECEKKAINEYRMAYQELMLTTNGKIGTAGRQMMNRKAQELDVTDSKKSIEEEIDSMYHSEPKAQQSDVITTAATTANKPRPESPAPQTSKSIGALSDEQPKIQPQNSKSGSKKWLILALIVVIILLGYIIFGGGGENSQQTTSEASAPAQSETVAPAKPQQSTQQQSTQTAQPKAETAPAKSTPAAAPAVKKDTNYEAGMKAYEAGNGLEAVKKFKASGSAQSYYMLGVIYESGCGSVGKNAMMARQNFKKAANMGHEEAKAKL